MGLAQADADCLAGWSVLVVLNVRDDGDRNSEENGQQPDGDGEAGRAADGGGLAATERVCDGDVAVETESNQREDGHAERHALKELVHATHRLPVRPFDKRVDCRCKRNGHEDEQQVSARQVHDEDVRHVVHARVAGHDEDQGAVAEDADDEDYQEEDRDEIGLGRPEEHRMARVRAVPAVGRRGVRQADCPGDVRLEDVTRH